MARSVPITTPVESAAAARLAKSGASALTHGRAEKEIGYVPNYAKGLCETMGGAGELGRREKAATLHFEALQPGELGKRLRA